MSEPLVGVVVCHASLAEGLVRAVESIAGVKGALEPVSNTGCDRGLLAGRIEAALEGRPGVVFWSHRRGRKAGSVPTVR